jgi:ubiquitin-protein ligase
VINHWNSNYSIIDILEAVYLLLVHPNENSPANVEAGEMIKNDLQCVKDKKPNPHTYEKKASEINAKYAYPI